MKKQLCSTSTFPYPYIKKWDNLSSKSWFTNLNSGFLPWDFPALNPQPPLGCETAGRGRWTSRFGSLDVSAADMIPNFMHDFLQGKSFKIHHIFAYIFAAWFDQIWSLNKKGSHDSRPTPRTARGASRGSNSCGFLKVWVGSPERTVQGLVILKNDDDYDDDDDDDDDDDVRLNMNWHYIMILDSWRKRLTIMTIVTIRTNTTWV